VTNNLPARWRDRTDADAIPAQPKPQRKRHV
jgi:hypothetical protein